MTDPETADATYIEPIHWEVVRKIIEKERPDAVLPTMGGQTALNCALELERQGVLAEFGLTMIGATADAIAPPFTDTKLAHEPTAGPQDVPQSSMERVQVSIVAQDAVEKGAERCDVPINHIVRNLLRWRVGVLPIGDPARVVKHDT